MDIQLVALDLDRTTLDRNGRLSRKNRDAIETVIRNGIHVCVASGRAFATVPEEVLSLKGLEYAVTSNGASVYYIPECRLLQSFLLDRQDVELILRLTESDPVCYEGFVRGKAYASADYVRRPARYGASERAVEYVKRTRTLIDDMPAFLLEHGSELDSMDILVTGMKMRDDIRKRIAQKTQNVYMTSSIAQLLEISHRDAGKHSGIAFLSEQLGIPREKIAAFGDAENDRDMLHFAGVGVAVENAVPQLKQEADFVTLSNHEDGVAHALEHILHLI